MRRILTAVLASSLLALALPVAASAHHSGRERHHHHHRRHHHAHTVVFAPTAKRSDTTTGTGAPTQTGESAATVASFEGGILKITLADGSTVSGKVTEGTEISCGCDGHHFEDGPQSFGHESGDDDGNDGPGFFHHDDEHAPQGQSSCDTSSLVAGAKVEEAELNVSGAGAVWEKVELVPQS